MLSWREATPRPCITQRTDLFTSYLARSRRFSLPCRAELGAMPGRHRLPSSYRSIGGYDSESCPESGDKFDSSNVRRQSFRRTLRSIPKKTPSKPAAGEQSPGSQSSKREAHDSDSAQSSDADEKGVNTSSSDAAEKRKRKVSEVSAQDDNLLTRKAQRLIIAGLILFLLLVSRGDLHTIVTLIFC